MNIEGIIRTVFEKEIGQLKIYIPPYRRDMGLPANKGKHGKERYGFLVLCMIMVLVISIFSLRTGLLRSPLLMEWKNIAALMPKIIVPLFLEFLTKMNSSV
jgi:hypothetical protein